MRLIKNIFIFLLLFIIAIAVFNYMSPWLTQITFNKDTDLQSLQFKEARVKLAYILDNQQWLSYSLQKGEDRVRIMTNAVLDKDFQVAATDRFMYSINYEVLDEAGGVIRSGRFYNRTGQKIFQDMQTGQQYVASRLYPAKANPVDTRIHQINLRGLKNAAKIRFKKGDFTYPVQQILLRAYQKRNIAERKLDYAWQRLGEEQRQQLARASVYDANILNAEEQRQLLINQWAPLGPLGVAGDNYITQKLYVVREVENDVVINDPAVPSTGLVIYPDHYGMITLPETQNQLKLSWRPFASSGRQTANDQLSIEWWGRPATRYKKWTPLLSAGELSINPGSGVLRISSQQPIVIRAWQKAGDVEITPSPAYLRLYSLASSNLVYRVNHIRGYKTPFRFDLRAINSKPLSAITYRLLDKHDRLIKTGQLSLKQQWSAYDAVVTEPDHWLTEPRQIYFNLSRTVSKVSFDASPGVWISAYTRPENLAYTQFDPVVLQQQNRSIPVWFSVRPQQWKDYMKGGSQLITVQRRPPQIDPQLLTGMYRWNQFYPDGNWKGRTLLNRLDDQQTFREETLSSRYVKLASGQTTELEFIAKVGTETLRPSLIYVQSQTRSMTIRMWLDEALYFESQVHAKNGELHLPYLPAGLHRVRIDTALPKKSAANELMQTPAEKTEFYINNTSSQQHTSLPDPYKPLIMLKRLAIEMSAKPLSFTILKEKPQELLAVRIYTRQSMQKKLKLNVKINGLDNRKTGPLKDWTLQYRQYVIDPLSSKATDLVETETAPLLLKTNHGVTGERLFFIPLGADLPVQQSYTIDVSLEQGADAYIILTRTVPGLYPSRQLYPDIEIETGNE